MTVRARVLVGDTGGALALGFMRLALPTRAREYLAEKLPLMHVLLTGLSREEARFISARIAADEAPGREAFPQFVDGDQQKRPGSALLSGRRDQFERLRDEARLEPEASGLAAALGRVLLSFAPPPALQLGSTRLVFGERTFIVGVVNVTPDSFSDGGRFFSAEAAVAHGLALARAGADLLDVGGESTRPGSLPVSPEEELARVLPVIRGLREKTRVPISIDTTKAHVAREAVRAGASLVNDISGLTADPALAEVVAATGAACCLMHLQGTPATMQQDPRYFDVLDAVLEHLDQGIERACAAGVPADRLLVDPGIGFGKTLGHNLFLLRRLSELRVLGKPLFVGTSRKGFIGALTGRKQASERLAGSLASVAAMAVLQGADFVRVHDVAETKEALAVADAIAHASCGGDAYEP